MDNEQCFFVQVPLNERGVMQVREWNEEYTNVRTFEIPESEHYAISNIYLAYNVVFDLLIASYEEDIMEAKYVPLALKMVRRFKQTSNDAVFLSGCAKLEEALELAASLNVLVEFDF